MLNYAILQVTVEVSRRTSDQCDAWKVGHLAMPQHQKTGNGLPLNPSSPSASFEISYFVLTCTAHPGSNLLDTPEQQLHPGCKPPRSCESLPESLGQQPASSLLVQRALEVGPQASRCVLRHLSTRVCAVSVAYVRVRPCFYQDPAPSKECAYTRHG